MFDERAAMKMRLEQIQDSGISKGKKLHFE